MADLSTRAGDALRALVAAGRIKSAWVPGMRGLWNDKRGGLYRPRAGDYDLCETWMRFPSARPDTDDPLTVFGLLLLAREAWGGQLVFSVGPGGGYVDWDWMGRASGIAHFDSPADEREAIVAALEAAAGLDR